MFYLLGCVASAFAGVLAAGVRLSLSLALALSGFGKTHAAYGSFLTLANLGGFQQLMQMKGLGGMNG